ncbi:MAG: STAS domain-containing protein, partial [Solirubrobacteraceae bacterium]
MDDARLTIELRQESDRAILALEGEFDLGSVPLLERELESEQVRGAAAVVLDLSRLEFMDSTGLRTLLSAQASAAERRQAFAVTEGGEQVERLLRVT